MTDCLLFPAPLSGWEHIFRLCGPEHNHVKLEWYFFDLIKWKRKFKIPGNSYRVRNGICYLTATKAFNFNFIVSKGKNLTNNSVGNKSKYSQFHIKSSHWTLQIKAVFKKNQVETQKEVLPESSYIHKTSSLTSSPAEHLSEWSNKAGTLNPIVSFDSFLRIFLSQV